MDGNVSTPTNTDPRDPHGGGSVNAMSVGALLWQAAGMPEYDGSTKGACRICGRGGAGLPFGRWVRRTFTDHDLLLPGDIICQPCQVLFDERNEELARRVGKNKPQRMRNYSHFVVNDRWIPLSKGDKNGMITILAQEPNLAVVATSGQKHLLFRARPGWWQIEEESTLPFPDRLWHALGLVELLYSSGFSKGEIESGRYYHSRIMEFGLNRFMRLEEELKPARGTLPLELAVFLAQKRELEDDGRLSAGIPYRLEADHPALARDTGRLQAEIRPEHLAAVRGSDTERGVHEQGESVRQLNLL